MNIIVFSLKGLVLPLRQQAEQQLTRITFRELVTSKFSREQMENNYISLFPIMNIFPL